MYFFFIPFFFFHITHKTTSGSEKLVRGLFSEAEAELSACNGDIARSALHVIVIDEIDAVFRRRSSGDDSGEQTRASLYILYIIVKR